MTEKGAYSPPRWATGWYGRRRHIVAPDSDLRAVCSPYTGVYALGNDRSSRPGVPVPPADSDAVMALTPCGLCLRKMRANGDYLAPGGEG